MDNLGVRCQDSVVELCAWNIYGFVHTIVSENDYSPIQQLCKEKERPYASCQHCRL